MTSSWIFLISFVALVAGIAIGMLLHRHLPSAQLGAGPKEVIRLGAGFLATLSAVLISLMIASAKNSYDTQAAHFRMLAAYLVETDQLLVQYGPESTQIRILMRQAVPAAVDRIWREKRSANQDSAFTAASLAEQINSAISALSPANDAQRALKRRIEEASDQIAKTRLLMFADGDVAILTPFLLNSDRLACGGVCKLFAVRRARAGRHRRAAGRGTLDLERAVPGRRFKSTLCRADANSEGAAPEYPGAD